MTKRQLSELIQRSMAGGTPSDDSEPKIDEIALWIGPGIAYAAKISYSDSVNTDGIEFVADSFYATYKNLSLTKDEDTGWYQATLPAKPYGLSPGYDITEVYVQGSKKLSQSLVRVNRKQVPFFSRLPVPPNRLFYWVEEDKINVKSFAVLDGESLRVTMASPAGTSGMDSQLNCPEEMIPGVVDFVKKQFLPLINLPKDNSNDGLNVR